MFKSYYLQQRWMWRVTAMLLWCSTATYGADIDTVKGLLDDGKVRDGIDLLVKEVADNPAHEAARILLAEAYEKAGRDDDAISTWQDLSVLSRNKANLRTTRRALSRLRRRKLDRLDLADLAAQDGSSSKVERADPFKISMPEIEWEGLEVIEDAKYLPPILPPPYAFEVPSFAHETEHFTVYSTNERLSKVIGEQAETYLEFMVERLFRGRSWPVRFPILVYPTYSAYVQHGAPEGTGGVTMGHVTGKTQCILLYQLKEQSLLGTGGSRGGGGGSGQGIWKYGIESVLPHELTHAVLNEFFSGQPVPTWLHEAVAGRFEQTRDHYGEAARLARKVVAGEYFRMRDLFDQKGYPQRVGFFYEQAAIVVLYLFETGPEAMHAFLSELAEGNDHDAACAAALGIPEENAVEEFERRWVQWMKMRYIKDLDVEADDTDIAEAKKSDNAIFLPWVNEMDTVDTLENWREIDLGSLEAFAGVGTSKQDWSAGGGKLHRKVVQRGTVALRSSVGNGAPSSMKAGDGLSSLLAIRMNERAPLVVRCDVKCLANPADHAVNRLFGFTQLDADLNDTPVTVLAPLRDNAEHKVVCLWSDDLAVYIDGICVGRFPAFHVTGDAPDVDYPLALVAFGPVEIQNLEVAPIHTFSDKPVVVAADSTDRQADPRRSGRRSRRRTGP